METNGRSNRIGGTEQIMSIFDVVDCTSDFFSVFVPVATA